MKTQIMWMAAGCLGIAACGDEGGTGKVSGGPCDPLTDPRGKPVACVTGALVDETGAPFAGIAVGACNKDVCIKTNTDAEGRYTIQNIEVVPQMMKVFGVPKGYMTSTWFQAVTAGEMSVADREIKLVPLPGNAVDLPETGGTAVLADGKIEVSAEEGSLVYPIGEAEKLEVALIDPADAPPFDIEPWAGKEKRSLMFIVHPFPLGVEGPIELKVKGVGATAGAPYRIYAADHITGRMEEGGSLVADEAGDLVLQPGASLENLTTVVIVPN